MSNTRSSRGGRMPRRHGDKELDQLQKLKYENDKLKRENSRLRKLIQRGQADQELLHELMVQKDREEEVAQAEKIAENRWRCYQCAAGVMKIHLLQRLDGVFYYRCCSNAECGHRTKLQKHTKDVQGVKHEEVDE
jgi:hypothetical protein